MCELVIPATKVLAKIMFVLAILTSLATCGEKMDRQDCTEKGKTLGAEVKFYHDRCYVKGYSDGR